MSLSFLSCFFFLLRNVSCATRSFDGRQVAATISIAVVERVRGRMFLHNVNVWFFSRYFLQFYHVSNGWQFWYQMRVSTAVPDASVLTERELAERGISWTLNVSASCSHSSTFTKKKKEKEKEKKNRWKIVKRQVTICHADCIRTKEKNKSNKPPPFRRHSILASAFSFAV